MKTPLTVGVLVSGRGSNLRALLGAFPAGHPLVRIVVVVSNRPGCVALGYAREAGIPVEIVNREDYSSRDAQQSAMAAALAAAEVDLVVLAGYDQVLGPSLLEPFAGRIINVHPSLLPVFGGTLHAQAAALQHGVKVTGCTVHFVTAAVDGGPIIAQAAVPVRDDDTVDTLSLRILAQEHILL
ncbi:MAG: phosphoribosylglycinamide formyltransferase, partial [Chloroflexota bacterium]